MAIAPLQLPGYATPQSLDFSSLANLGQVYKQAQADATRRDTLAQLGQGDKIDPRVLLASGDLSLANLGVQIQNRQQDQERQSRLDQRQTSRDAVDDRFREESLRLQKAAAARANEDKPLIKEVTDPNTGSTSFVRINPRTGELSPLGAPQAPSQPNNPFAYGKQNEGQSKDSGYANRLFDAEQTLRDPGVIEAGTSLKQKGLEAVPVAGAYLTSPERQKYDQSARNFINGVLRRESGAAISQSEFDNAYKQYLPQPGDSPERLAEKQKNRQATIASIAGGGGQSYRPPFSFGPNGELIPTGNGKQGAGKQAPSKGDPLAAARDAIQRGADPNAVRQRLQQNGIDPSGL